MRNVIERDCIFVVINLTELKLLQIDVEVGIMDSEYWEYSKLLHD